MRVDQTWPGRYSVLRLVDPAAELPRSVTRLFEHRRGRARPRLVRPLWVRSRERGRPLMLPVSYRAGRTLYAADRSAGERRGPATWQSASPAGPVSAAGAVVAVGRPAATVSTAMASAVRAAPADWIGNLGAHASGSEQPCPSRHSSRPATPTRPPRLDFDEHWCGGQRRHPNGDCSGPPVRSGPAAGHR